MYELRLTEGIEYRAGSQCHEIARVHVTNAFAWFSPLIQIFYLHTYIYKMPKTRNESSGPRGPSKKRKADSEIDKPKKASSRLKQTESFVARTTQSKAKLSMLPTLNLDILFEVRCASVYLSRLYGANLLSDYVDFQPPFTDRPHPSGTNDQGLSASLWVVRLHLDFITVLNELYR